ncbi:universal stress protein [Streptomyces sp. NPDC020490]|uniref:universal stress protein n=1 Tax=Streptomyces sp. NPDC020490 TaxID=3365078 RepID=UPI0037BA3756
MSPHIHTRTRTLARPAATGAPALPLSLPHPVTAVITDRPDDAAVVDAAVRLAAARKAPVLLVAVLPAPPEIPARTRVDARTDRGVLDRVLPRLRRAGIGYIPVAHRVPADGDGRIGPGAAGEVLALAARHHSPLVVASSRGPAGLDAHSLIEAARPRGGPFVYAVAPARWTAPVAGAGLGPAELSPAGVRTVWTLVRRSPAATPAARMTER